MRRVWFLEARTRLGTRDLIKAIVYSQPMYDVTDTACKGTEQLT
jgi:hypothetical protein